MKAATLLSLVLVGAMSTGVIYAESGDSKGFEKLKERWEKRHTEKEAMREKLESELKQQDAALEKVQGELKSASSGDKKIEALTAAVNTLIDQRREMHKRMENFGEKMRRHAHDMKEKFQKGAESMTPPAAEPSTSPAEH